MQQPKFKIGDRVTYKSPALLYQKIRGIGKVVRETAEHYYIIWEDEPKMVCPHLKEILFDPSNELIKAKKQPAKTLRSDVNLGDRVRNIETKVEGVVTYLSDRCINIKNEDAIESHNLSLGTPKLEILENIPELSSSPKTHGYLEEYFVVNKQRKVYFYTRYVYQSSGKLKHHHVGKKQKESIEALWRSGATAKQICVAIGKNYQGDR